WESELVVPTYDRVTPAPPLAAAARATIGLATEGGLVPAGNPDRLEAVRATRWARYDVLGWDTLANSGYQSVHGGYDARWVHEDPNRMVPLDAARTLEQAGAVGRLHDAYYATVGCGTAIDRAT